MSSHSAALASLLFGISGALALLGSLAGITALRDAGRKTETWRDPAPVLFRLLLPAARILAAFSPGIPEWLCKTMRKKLDAAGMAYAILPEELLALRVLTAVLALALGIAFNHTLDASSGVAVLIITALIAVGFNYPTIWLRDLGKKRGQQIERAFPALLELLTLSVRAGLSFSVALEQCTEQLRPGPLAIELRRVNREIRTGTTRREALEHLGERVETQAVQAFVSAVIQAEETGAAISNTLQDQATQQRRERFNRAEHKANEAPVKLLLPLVGLLFPLTFLIIAFPILMQFADGGLF